MVAVICGVFGKAPFGVALEVVENPVEVVLVEDEAHALLDAHQAGEPQGLPGAALDADVGHGFLLGEAAFHVVASCLGSSHLKCGGEPAAW